MTQKLKPTFGMKNFLLFGNDDYEARGGWHDFMSDHDTLDEAKAAVVGSNRDNFHIVSLADEQVVRQGSRHDFSLQPPKATIDVIWIE